VHGNSASKEAFRPVIQSTPVANRRLIAFDFPGCGASSDAENWQEVYTLPGLAQTLIELVHVLNIPDYIVLGWSLGGHVAIEALRFGLVPRGLVLTGTPPCGPSAEEIASTFLSIEGSQAMGAENPPADVFASFVRAIYAPTVPSEALVRDGKRADGRLRRRIFEHLAENPDSPPQRATVAAWPGPIAVIQGDEEPFFAPPAVENLQWENLWRGKVQWIKGAGHAPFLDAPEDYATLLEAFAVDVTGTT
jgi:pimeloyl-ACP methyl ester carboxylesterase